MKTFTRAQLQEAHDWRPQIERFILSSGIYVIESLPDYENLDSRVQEVLDLRNSAG